MGKIAFVTCDVMSDYDTDIPNEDIVLMEYFQKQGTSVDLVIWNDSKIDWKLYALVIIRSTWDYYLKAQEFRDWLGHLKTNNIQLWNSADLILWNMEKTYLTELQNAGVDIIPTRWLNAGTKPLCLSNYFQEFHCDKLVVKPTISLGSADTFLVTQENIEEIESIVSRFVLTRNFMIQPFLEEVKTVGEYSMIYLDCQYSHTILKTPRANEYRVQRQFGGVIQSVSPTPEMIEQAEKVLQYLHKTLFVRVDGIISNGIFRIMEVEAIEPWLYLHFAPQEIEKFYQATMKKLW